MLSRSLLVLLILSLGGCSWFSWLPFIDGGSKGDSDLKEKLKPAELERFSAEVDIQRLWRGSVGEGLGRKYLRLEPAIVADAVFTADAYGVVEARDRFSGKKRWRSRIGEVEEGFFHIGVMDRRDPSFVTGGVGSGGGMIMLGTTAGEVVALNAADGVEVWRAEVGSEVLAPPVYGDDLVFVQTVDGRLLALEASNGEFRWSFDNQVPVLTLRGTAAPVFHEQGVVIAGFASGKVSAIRADSGEPIWEHRVMLPEGRSELDRMVDVDSRPLILGASLYTVSYQGRLKSLRLGDGSPLWEKEVSSYLDLAQGYGQLYVINDQDEVEAIDLESAESVWTQEKLFRRKLSNPVAYSNYVLVGDEEGYLHVLAQSDGRFLARKKIDSKGIRSGPIVADEVVYILGNSGSITALEIAAR